MPISCHATSFPGQKALRRGLFLALLQLAVACGGGRATEAESGTPQPGPINPALFLILETGTLPVVLSAPHGGSLNLPGIPERTTGTTVLDTNTQELAQAIQARLQVRTGKKAHMVVALASRKYVDFNRTASEAYEATLVAPLYFAYHQALQAAVSAAHGQSAAHALLLDLHGQGDAPSMVFRGTRDGRTAALPDLLGGPTSFLSGLAAGGVLVSPPTVLERENPDFTGGYIVASYGLLAASGIPAVQLEFGLTYRQNAQLQATAVAVVEALIGHLQDSATSVVKSSPGLMN